MPRAPVFGSALSLFVMVSAARADAPAADSGGYARYRIAAELSIVERADSNETLWVTSPLLNLDYAFSRHFGIGVDWGFVLVNETPRQGSALWLLGSADPLFKLWLSGASADGRSHWSLSAGLTTPLAGLSYDIEKRGVMRSAYANAAATRGLWNVWLWAPEQIALVVSGAWTRELSPELRLQLEAGVAGSRGISHVTYDVADAYLQLAASLEVHGDVASAGLRLQEVLMTSSSDAAQTSAGPYFSVRWAEIVLALRAVVNIDAPLGFLNAGLHTVGVLLSMQAKL